MINKKTGLGIVVMITILSLLFGCSSGWVPTGASAGKRVQLRFLEKWPDPEYAPYFEQVVNEFEQTHPNIIIKMEAVADDPMKDKLRTAMGGGHLPDVSFSWSGQFAKKFVNAGAALDLTKYLNDDPKWKNSFIPSALQPFQFNGKNYGIPIRLDGKFLVYNKKIFKKYQLEVPKNWQEFMELCKKLKNHGVTPILLGNQEPWAAIHYLTGLNQKWVPNQTLTKDYNPKSGQFTNRGYVKALESLKSIQDKGYFNRNINSVRHDFALQQLAYGKGAMMYLETEEFADLAKEMTDDWGIFPLPDITEGKGNQNYLTGAPDGFIISSKTKHRKEAIEFLKFLTGKKSQEKMVKMNHWNSAIKGAVNKNNALKQTVEAQKYMEQTEGLSQWLDTAMDSQVADVYQHDVQPLLNGKMTPEQVMKDVQKTAQVVRKH